MVFHSLRTKFVCLFFAFFFVPYALLSYLSISRSIEMMKRSTMDHLQNLVEVKQAAIGLWLEKRLSDGITLAQSPEVMSLDPDRIASSFTLFKPLVRSYRAVWVFDLAGKVVSGVGETVPTVEKGFERALEDKPMIVTSALETEPSRSTVSFLIGIRDPEGHPAGVLKALVDLAFLPGLTAELNLGKTGELFLVNAQGALVLHKTPSTFRRHGRLRISYLHGDKFKPAFTGVYRDDDGNQVLGSIRWIQDLECYLVAEQDAAEAFQETTALTRSAVLIFVASSFVIFFTSYWVMGRATAPIKRLSETVASFADGHFEKSVSTRREDEIGVLIAGFNAMSWKLENAYALLAGKVEASDRELAKAYQMLKQRQEQLVRSETMAALGQLSAGFAHEIRNPLTSFKIFIQSLAHEMDLHPSQMDDIRIISKEIDRMDENISRFLSFARPEEPSFQRVEIGSIVRETVSLVAMELRKSGIREETRIGDEGLFVEGDPKQLAQVLLNLILNAIEAMPQGGVLTISASVAEKPVEEEEFIELVVSDTGQGISEGDRPNLFDPFFTTKPGGTGLGLSIVYSIIQKHHGRIEVESEVGKGSSFRLLLPVPSEAEWSRSSS